MNFRGFLMPVVCRACAVAVLLTVPAISQELSLESLVDGARLAMKGQKWQQALDYSTQAVTRFGKDEPLRNYGPQFGAVYYHKGVCELKLQKWQEAMQSFEICYRDFSNVGAVAARENHFQKMALRKWGEAAMGAENWELALSRFSKFLEERDKTRDRFPRGAFYIDLAICHYRLGHLAEGNENLEIAIRNKEDFPTPEVGIIAGFQALVRTAIEKHDEQVLLDFIGKNRGELIIEPEEMRPYSVVFLKLAGDALAADMQRAALAVYQFIPSPGADPAEGVRLAALALIHEKNGNVRGAFAAYVQLETYHPAAANREDSLYQLVRTATLVGEIHIAQGYAHRLLKDFPQSKHLADIRAAGIEPAEDGAAPHAPRDPAPAKTAAMVLPKAREFAGAIDLYQGRKYHEAKAVFIKLRSHTESTLAADRDRSMLAAFYEMECLRKLGDLEALAEARRVFVKDSALGQSRLRQLEIDELWECVRTKNWQQLERLAQDPLRERLTGDQRAQVAYCQALALENLGRPTEALNAYNIALTADAGASEEIARLAALAILRIYQADPEVQAARVTWGTPEEHRDSPGYFRLKEAAAVAVLFQLSLGAGAPLPAEFGELVKYHAKP